MRSIPLILALLPGALGLTGCSSAPEPVDPPPVADAPASSETTATEPEKAEPAYRQEPRAASKGERDPRSTESAQLPSPRLRPEASDDRDWVLLKTGERLAGEVIELDRDTLRFDSDELDELELDWDAVAELRSPRATLLVGSDEVRNGDRQQTSGKLLVVGDEVFVERPDGTREAYARSELISLIRGEPSEANYWTAKLSLGATVRSGNTNQSDLNVRARAGRRTSATRLRLEYSGNFGKLDGEENVNNHRFDESFDVFLTRRFYLSPLLAEAFRDTFQNIAYRVTPGAGLGYTVVDLSWVEWGTTLGAGYRYVRYDSVAPGGDEYEGTAAVIFTTQLDMDITDDIELDMGYKVQIGVPEVADTNHNAHARIEIELTSVLDLDVGVQWDHVGQPRRDQDGNVPRKDDVLVTVGIGLEY